MRRRLGRPGGLTLIAKLQANRRLCGNQLRRLSGFGVSLLHIFIQAISAFYLGLNKADASVHFGTHTHTHTESHPIHRNISTL